MMRTTVLLASIFLLFYSQIMAAFENYDREMRRCLIKKPVIEDISLTINSESGETSIKESQIKDVLFSRQKSFFRSINIFRWFEKDRRRRIQRETVMRDTSEVKYLYLTNGFLAVKVTEEFECNEAENKARIKITIDEGRQFYYGLVTLGGDYRLRYEKEFLKIIDKFNYDRTVNPFQLQQAAYNIKAVLANNGYPYARTRIDIDTLIDQNRADVVFFIESDSLVHYGDINVYGADKFDPSLVKRELTFQKGDTYRRKDILESQKRLLGTGYYLTLRLDSEKPDSAENYDRLNPDFILNLRERRPQYVSFRTGAEQDSIKDLIWSVGASWGKRNFLKSRTLELSARGTFEIFTDWRLLEHVYRTSISEPWFLGLKMPLTLAIQLEPGVPAPVQPYKIERWSVTANTTRKIGEKLKLMTGLQYEQLRIYDISTEMAEQEIKQEEGISVRRKFYFNAIRDSRNSIFIPTRGSVTTFRFDYVGGFLGGDDSFYLLEAGWAKYQKAWPGWISATRIKSGVVREMKGSPSVPVEDRFYIGGANTIRGYDEKELGPRDDSGNVIGSNLIVIFNQEFRFPLISKFWGSLFVDVGNGYRGRDYIKWDNLAITYGIGIQFISPAGPIRLDYARKVREVSDLRTGEKIDWDKFHFTILYAF